MSISLKRALFTISTTMLFIQVISVPFGMIYAETETSQDRLNHEVNPAKKNTIEKKEIEPIFSFEKSSMSGRTNEPIQISFLADQEVLEVNVVLPEMSKIVEELLPAEISIQSLDKPNNWIIRSERSQSQFSLPVVFSTEGIQEISVEGSTLQITIIDKGDLESLPSTSEEMDENESHIQSHDNYPEESFEETNQLGSVIINYVDINGNQLSKSEAISGKVGEEYATTPKEIPNYYPFEKPDNVNGIIDGGTIVVNYEYVQVNDELVNSDFEEPVITRNVEFLNESDVPGWSTTASDKKIELGLGPAHNISGAASGRQFAELNANEPSMLYQLVNYEPGTILRWYLHHAGRFGIDVMRLRIGAPDNPNSIQELSSGRGLWTLHSGTYRVPEDQLVTYFGFEAVSTSNGVLTTGNLIDNIHFAEQSRLVVTNQVNKEIAQAGEELTYNINIENTGGVPSDRLEIKILGIENLEIIKESIQLDGRNIQSDQIEILKNKLIIKPDVTVDKGKSVDLNFNGRVKSDYVSGEIETKVQIEYWDKGFDDQNYNGESNIAYTKIRTLTPKPVDPLAPENEVDPENLPELPENQGLLSIDFASSFNFGQQNISVKNQTYYAQPQRLLNEEGTVNETQERPNFIQISDRRPDNERSGWQLSVTQNGQFSNQNGHELLGSEIHLLNQELVTAQGGTAPTLQEETVQRIIPNTKRILLQADEESGTGTWIYRFGDAETAGKSVGLYVPKGTNPEAKEYSTTLTWELSSVPGN
ncbi:WxL domain-containing protein [Candidatus Enterococcus mangumiae]|uniref:WxL domain-containing protein n=1 Tax=Candidatus Enterococcus mangumiae TaxID=2230878 RepID=A0ABZ2SX33_9ENTE|nr:WxL domain-containing protein [Enterococcus sp. DIV1094]MBO0489629.1 WxL domain-containing protein [Enterococcus sp. DIV1094]